MGDISITDPNDANRDAHFSASINPGKNISSLYEGRGTTSSTQKISVTPWLAAQVTTPSLHLWQRQSLVEVAPPLRFLEQLGQL